jgi:hypothetical protein
MLSASNPSSLSASGSRDTGPRRTLRTRGGPSTTRSSRGSPTFGRLTKLMVSRLVRPRRAYSNCHPCAASAHAPAPPAGNGSGVCRNLCCGHCDLILGQLQCERFRELFHHPGWCVGGPRSPPDDHRIRLDADNEQARATPRPLCANAPNRPDGRSFRLNLRGPRFRANLPVVWGGKPSGVVAVSRMREALSA